jgi:hypothetical protein
MADVHVAHIGLVKVDPVGNIIGDGSSVDSRLNFSTEHRVLFNLDIPSTYAENSDGETVATYPTIPEYAALEAANFYEVRHLDQYTIVTAKNDTSFIVSETTPGLLGVENSLDYRVSEIERHLHNAEIWFGEGGGGLAERNSLTPWTLTCGAADTFGAETQLTDGSQFPPIIVQTYPAFKYDMQRLEVINASANNSTYMIEFYVGSGTFADADFLTSIPYRQANQSVVIPVALVSRRTPTSYNMWARAKSQNAGATIQIIIGVHFYEG